MLERAAQFRSTHATKVYEPLLKLYEGLSAYKLGQSEYAMEKLSSVQKTHPVAALAIGNLYDARGLYAKAVESYQTVLRYAKPGSALEQSAIYALAWSQYNQKNYIVAKDQFARLSRSNDEPLRLTALIKMGDAHFNLHAYKDAAMDYTTVLNALESRKSTYQYCIRRYYSVWRGYKAS